MRFSAQETTGSRFRLRYSVDLHYDLSGPAEFLINVHAAKTPRQTVVEEAFEVTPPQPWSIECDPAIGNRIAKLSADTPALDVHYTGLVEIQHRIVEPSSIVAENPVDLPVESLRYLYPSRYCQADLVSQRAWDLFGHLPRSYGQVLAVRDWVRSNITFRIGTSHSGTTALDTMRECVGVCRDFAHTMITYCRALNYPSRFVTAVDYGADPGLGPPDFHAYVEVMVGGTWYMFDATGISPITGLIRIGTGRDAADVSFATIFGPVKTGMPKVSFEAVDDPANGFALPVQTELAVSTAA
jgi:transglutaminase-like putative cysteine protease